MGATTSAVGNIVDGAPKKQDTYQYDDFGRCLRETDPLNRSWVWTYDVYGNVLIQLDAKGQRTTFTWKAGGLPETRTSHSGGLTTWTHDELGQLRSVGDRCHPSA